MSYHLQQKHRTLRNYWHPISTHTRYTKREAKKALDKMRKKFPHLEYRVVRVRKMRW